MSIVVSGGNDYLIGTVSVTTSSAALTFTRVVKSISLKNNGNNKILLQHEDGSGSPEGEEWPIESGEVLELDVHFGGEDGASQTIGHVKTDVGTSELKTIVSF